MKSIKDLQVLVIETNRKLGWFEQEVPVPEAIALIHSEVSEALESWRNNEPISWVG